MKKRVATLAVLLALLSAEAFAREPVEDDWLPQPPLDPVLDPVAFVVPDGLYYVTDTYVDDVVATSGATTTYSTTTIHESTGTYARVIDTVGTGASSGFDGLAFNGRGALTDGRALAGTYYQNFVLTPDGYVPVSIVFFQDDSETRRHQVASSASPAPAVSPVSANVPGALAAAPQIFDASSPPFSTENPTAPASPTLRAGIALAPDGPTLASAEVLRGRLTNFWPRAFADDRPVAIRSWRLISAQPDHVSASSGSVEPLAAEWIQMPAPGVTWSLQVEIVTELAPLERLAAQITVTVRSPALID